MLCYGEFGIPLRRDGAGLVLLKLYIPPEFCLLIMDIRFCYNFGDELAALQGWFG